MQGAAEKWGAAEKRGAASSAPTLQEAGEKDEEAANSN
jgi:hypothetical protein